MLSIVLTACGGSDTSVEDVVWLLGMCLSAFVGVCRGAISAQASAGVLSESFSELVTITNEDGCEGEGDDIGVELTGTFNKLM